MTSYSEVIPVENSDRNLQPSAEKDKRFLIRQQLYYLFHAFRCTRLAYTTGQGDCQNQHCIMMRNVVKHITKCQLGKECTFQHCPSSKEIIKHWKNCNDVECQVCTPLRRNNGVKKPVNIVNKDVNGLNVYRDQLSRDKDNYEVNWRDQLCRIRPHLLTKLTDELLPVKVCEDVKNHPGYSEVNNYVKGFEMDIFQNSRNLNEYFYKLAEKFEFVYRNLLAKYQTKENKNLVIVNPSISRFENTNKPIEVFFQLIKFHYERFYPDYSISSERIILKKDYLSVKAEGLTQVKDEYIEPVTPVLTLRVPSPQQQQPPPDNSKAAILSDNLSHIIKLECSESPNNNNNSGTNPVEPKSISSNNVPVIEDKMSPDSTSAPNKSNVLGQLTWTNEAILNMFLPIYDELFDDKDSEPFKYPVNWELLDIPDYPIIIKRPMDLSTIRDKLINGAYNDPWEVVDDFWLMFNNAWLYNKKTSKVYKMCNTLAKIFESKIDDVMVSCGYCCGREYVFLPQVLICCTPNVCLIVRDAVYYAFQNDNSNGEKIINDLTCDKYLCCEKCYTESNEEVQFINPENNAAPCKVQKVLLTKCRNNVKENEEFVYCRECSRKWHKVCANYLEEIVKESFICQNCVREKNVKIRNNVFKSKSLPQNYLSRYLESRVNTFLREQDPSVNEVVIRVLSISDKVVEVKPGMKSHYCETCEMPESFKYRLKAIFAFQEIDGHEVCFFGLHVQEYGSDCPDPNCRRVYISYLDSVHYFHPRQYRTDVYHEFLIGYLDYVKKLGFTMAHIWACPPGEGDDYIFHMHPPEQRLPKPKRLQEWYIKMLDKAMKESIVIDYKDIFSDALHSNMLSPTELPYFDGDYWPNALEEIFKEIDDESIKRRCNTDPTYFEEIDNSKLEIVSKNNMSKMDKKPKKRKIKKMNPIVNKRKRSTGSDGSNDVSRRVLELIEKRKENFFVIRLHTQIDAANLPEIADPDPLMSSDLMDGRDKFLCLAREKHLEFSSLRRAKFSTLVFCYELHQEQKNTILYTCNACNKQIEVRYSCRQCEDFELCTTCYTIEKHPHPLFKIDLDEESTSSNSQTVSQPTTELQDTTRARMVRYSQSLQHACQCRDVNCRMNFCAKMKVMIKHLSCCTLAKNVCKICQSFLRICFVHAKFCNDAKCQVPNCLALRFSWKQQGSQQRMQQAQMLRRRVALMQRGISVEANSVPIINSQISNVSEPDAVKNTNQCDSVTAASNNSNKVFISKMESSPMLSYHNTGSSNVNYSNEIIVTDEDVRLVLHQYNSFLRNFPIKEEFQNRFGEWLNSSAKYRIAYDILLKKIKRQNDSINSTMYNTNVSSLRDQQQQLNKSLLYPSYSQTHWQTDNMSLINYPQSSYNFPSNGEISNGIVYDYNGMNQQQRLPMPNNNNNNSSNNSNTNSVYIASKPGAALSQMHQDSVHKMSFQLGQSFVNGAGYGNNFPTNSMPPRFSSQSLLNNHKSAQPHTYRCLPPMHQHQQLFNESSNSQVIPGCNLGSNNSIMSQQQQLHQQKQQQQQQQYPGPFPPQYLSHNSQLDQRAASINESNSPGGGIQHSYPHHLLNTNASGVSGGSSGVSGVSHCPVTFNQTNQSVQQQTIINSIHIPSNQ